MISALENRLKLKDKKVWSRRESSQQLSVTFELQADALTTIVHFQRTAAPQFKRPKLGVAREKEVFPFSIFTIFPASFYDSVRVIVFSWPSCYHSRPAI